MGINILIIWSLLGDALYGTGSVSGMEGGLVWRGNYWDNMVCCSVVSYVVYLV